MALLTLQEAEAERNIQKRLRVVQFFGGFRLFPDSEVLLLSWCSVVFDLRAPYDNVPENFDRQA